MNLSRVVAVVDFGLKRRSITAAITSDKIFAHFLLLRVYGIDIYMYACNNMVIKQIFMVVLKEKS